LVYGMMRKMIKKTKTKNKIYEKEHYY